MSVAGAFHKLGKKLTEKLFRAIGKGFVKTLMAIRDAFYGLLDRIRCFFTNPLCIILLIIFVVLIIVFYIVALVILNNYTDSMNKDCTEGLSIDSILAINKVDAKPSNLIMDNGYKYEVLTQKSSYETNFDATLDKSSYETSGGIIPPTVKLSITGTWSPWFGDENVDYMTINTPDDKFLCNMQKVVIDNSGDTSYGGVNAENEYYFLRNYYSDVKYDSKTLKYTILDSNLQQQCKINRGMGLYMGFFGKDGTIEPEHFHHILATQAICESQFMFGGNPSGLKVNYGNNQTYKIKDFKKDYFRITKNADNEKNSITVIENDIFKASGNKYIYDIEKHEELLRQNLGKDSKDVGLIIANAISVFNEACYKTNSEGKREKRAQFIFEASFKSDIVDDNNNLISEIKDYENKHRLLKQYQNKTIYKTGENGTIDRNFEKKGTVGTEYEDGEVIKFFILDRYYSDNQGDYKIEFLNGVRVQDRAGTIETFLKKVEIFMLGSRIPNSDKDRIDGLLFKIYTGIIANSGLATLAKVIMSLFIVVNGFMIILGYKKFEKKEFMMFCIKMPVLFAFFSETAWSLFNSTIINFIVNGTIGAVNLVYDILKEVFNGFGVSNMFVANSYFDETKYYYLASNFRFLDTVFDFLFSKDVHIRVFSWIVDFPIVGLLPFVFFYSILFKYVFALLGSIIPYITTLVQITILLALTPIFLLFMFAGSLQQYFKNWLNYLLSRMFELIVFFFVIFFASELVNNRFLDALSFNICKINLGKEVVESIPSDNAGGRILRPIIQNILGDFFTLSNDENDYFRILFNLILLACYVYLYQQFTQFLTKLLTQLYSFDGQSFAGGTGGGYFDSSLDQQMIKATGIDKAMGTIQKFMGNTVGFDKIAKYTGLNKIQLFNNGKLSVGTALRTGLKAGKETIDNWKNFEGFHTLGFGHKFSKGSINQRKENYLKEKDENRRENREIFGDKLTLKGLKQRKELKKQMGEENYKKAKREARGARFRGDKDVKGTTPHLDALRLGKVSAKINDVNKQLEELDSKMGDLDKNSDQYKNLQSQKINLLTERDNLQKEYNSLSIKKNVLFKNSIINRYNNELTSKEEKQELLNFAKNNNILTDEEIKNLKNGKLKVEVDDKYDTLKSNNVIRGEKDGKKQDKAKDPIKRIKVHFAYDDGNREHNEKIFTEIAKDVLAGRRTAGLVGMSGMSLEDLDKIAKGEISDEDYEKLINFMKVGSKNKPGSGYGRKLDEDYRRNKEAFDNANLSIGEMQNLISIENSIGTKSRYSYSSGVTVTLNSNNYNTQNTTLNLNNKNVINLNHININKEIVEKINNGEIKLTEGVYYIVNEAGEITKLNSETDDELKILIGVDNEYVYYKENDEIKQLEIGSDIKNLTIDGDSIFIDNENVTDNFTVGEVNIMVGTDNDSEAKNNEPTQDEKNKINSYNNEIIVTTINKKILEFKKFQLEIKLKNLPKNDENEYKEKEKEINKEIEECKEEIEKHKKAIEKTKKLKEEAEENIKK